MRQFSCTTLAALLLSITVPAIPALGEELELTPAPDGAVVYFITPAHGETITGPVTVRFGLDGMGVAPAGVDHASTGHHHLLIDLPDGDLPALDRPLPASNQVVHFGGGQTQVTLELEPGVHTLQLLLGDHRHVPHAPPVLSERITIRVEAVDEADAEDSRH
ncbi:DUF4399 domain-containing protein [Halomonas denitrificans]|nr:DUF4399 domain-containing protein [Halomonas denitrificans]